MNPLRELDERVLPRLGRGLHRILGGLGALARGSVTRRALLLVVAVTAIVATTVTALSLGGRPRAADLTTGDVVRVGVTDGQRVADYVKASRSELAALPAGRAETYALVAFSSYLEPAVLYTIVAGVPTVRVYARVPLPDIQTEIVSFPVNTITADVPAEMRRTAARKERDARESDRSAAALTGDSPRERQLRAFYRQDAEVIRAEAGAYHQLCPCVYGAVVRATPDGLRRLAARPGVRVVDPAPEVRRLDRTVFLPLQPEQRSVVAPPPDAGVPSASGR